MAWMSSRALGLLSLGAAVYLALGAKPWHAGVAEALAQGRTPALAQALPWGFWWGAAAVVLVSGGLALTHRWWWSAAPATLDVPRLSEPPMKALWWWAALCVVVAGTAAHRWPRLSHSLWGDESLALAAYIQDHYIVSNPERRLEPLKLKKVPWSETWFGDRETGNNHYLFSVLCRHSLDKWREWNGRKRHEFSEAAARAPAFAGGLAMLVAVAWLGRRLAGPRTGLLAAVLLAIHPWHLRYCTEARGYSLMGFFLCVSLGVLVVALETGAWSVWLGFAALGFLSIYSCKIAVYPLAMLNVIVAVALWRRGKSGAPRWQGLARWFVSNALAALVFIVLYAPCHPQAVGGATKIQKRGQTEYSTGWFLDMASEAGTGIPWRTFSPDSAVQVSWSKIWQARPEVGGHVGLVLGAAGLAALALVLAAGVRRMWRESRPAAWGAAAIVLGVVALSVHLKHGLKFEILPWYMFFTTPALCLVAAIGAAGLPWRRLVLVGVPLLYAAAVLPLNRAMIRHPYEDLRGAMEITRGRHESPYRKAPSRVYTCWLWRSSALYDPRGNSRIRTLPMLNYAIRETRRAKGELYMIIGYPELSARITPAVYKRVTGDASFEKIAEFPAQVPRHTLMVYRYVPRDGRDEKDEKDESDEGTQE